LQDAGTSDAGRQKALETLEAIRGTEEAAGEAKKAIEDSFKPQKKLEKAVEDYGKQTGQ
jgi:hypothetical protein